MSLPDFVIAVAITIGTWIGILVRAVFWVIVIALGVVAFILLMLWGMTAMGRKIEYHTRPEK